MQLNEQPYLVLGVDSSATLPEIRARYRVLLHLFHPDRLHDAPEEVRQEAQRRIGELNAAYASVMSALGAQAAGGEEADWSDPDTNVINPQNAPLASLRPSVRTPNTADFWQHVGLEPIMIRVYEGTGLTLCTPSVRDDDTRAMFLSDDGHLHIARSAQGLVDLAGGLPDHELLGLQTWPDLVEEFQARHVAVLPIHKFDIPAAIDNLSQGTDLWDPKLLIALYDVVYELAISLDLRDVYEALMPDSPLHRLYRLVNEMDSGPLSRWMLQREIERFNLVDVYDAWTDISAILSENFEWH